LWTIELRSDDYWWFWQRVVNPIPTHTDTHVWVLACGGFWKLKSTEGSTTQLLERKQSSNFQFRVIVGTSFSLLPKPTTVAIIVSFFFNHFHIRSSRIWFWLGFTRFCWSQSSSIRVEIMGVLLPLFFYVIAFFCTVGAIALAILHIYRHLLNYTEPTYQRFIVRIVFMVPVS